MQRLRGYDDVEDEMDEMKIEASKIQSVKAFSIKQLLVTPGLRLPTFIATMSMAAQQLSGINAVGTSCKNYSLINTQIVV